MKQSTRNQKGSESRDYFKWLHKNLLSHNFYALDSDLELIEKVPVPFVVARLDFKLEEDPITFTEAIAYNQLVNAPEPWCIPVYVVEAGRPFVGTAAENHRFTIYRFVQADWRPEPPVVERELIAQGLTWQGLGAWEDGLRQRRRKERGAR
jgi:hypothetical protein